MKKMILLAFVAATTCVLSSTSSSKATVSLDKTNTEVGLCPFCSQDDTKTDPNSCPFHGGI